MKRRPECNRNFGDEDAKTKGNEVFDKIKTLKDKCDEVSFYNELYNLFREDDNTFKKEDIRALKNSFENSVYQNKSEFAIFANKYEWLVILNSLQEELEDQFLGSSLALNENSITKICEFKFQHKNEVDKEIKEVQYNIERNIKELKVQRKMTSQFAKSLEALQLHFDNFWQYMEAFSTKTNSESFFLDLKKKCDELKRFLEGHIEDEGSHAIP